MSNSHAHYDGEPYGTGNGSGFMVGLVVGAALGAGLGILMAPKSGADLRGQIGEQARQFGNMASTRYRRASETASHWAERGREMVGSSVGSPMGDDQGRP